MTVTSQPRIVVGAGAGGGPHVRTFDITGNGDGGFFAYASGVTVGVFVAALSRSIDDNDQEIITGTGGSGAHVRIFSASGAPAEQWFASDQTRGVTVAGGVIQ
jgi:hypothetical protein